MAASLWVLVIFSLVLFSAVPVHAFQVKDVMTNIKIPLRINVRLIGEKSTSYAELGKILSDLFPVNTPSVSGGVDFQNDYHLHYSGYAVLKNYENLIRDTFVSPLTVLKFIDYLKKSVKDDSMTASNDNLPVVIVLPNTILPRHSLTNDNEHCSQTYIGDVLFVDLSAFSCDLSNVVGKGNYFMASGYSSNVWGSIASPQDRPDTLFAMTQLSSIIISAAQRFSVSNELQYMASYSAEKVIVPIVFLRSTASENMRRSPEDIVNSTKSWLENILLPTQSSLVLSSTHFIEDHPQLTIALASAARWYAVEDTRVTTEDVNSADNERRTRRVPYLDSSQLISELAQIGDNLCRRLMVDAGEGYEDDTLFEIEAFFQSVSQGGHGHSGADDAWMHSRYGIGDDYSYHRHMRRASKGTVIAPVFILSDLVVSAFANGGDDVFDTDGFEHPLFDREHHIASKQGVSLILHADSEVMVHKPREGGWKDLPLDAIGNSIADALARTLSGLRPPHISPEGMDMTWVLGSHPFIPFGSLNIESRENREIASKKVVHMSDVLSWASRRGIAISRGAEVIRKLSLVVDRAAFFVLELSRPLSLLLPPGARQATLSTPARIYAQYDVSDEQAVEEIVKHIFAPVAFLDEIVRKAEKAAAANGGSVESVEYVPTDLVKDISDGKELVKVLLQEIADVKKIIEEGSSLLSDQHMTTAEESVQLLEERFLEAQRKIKVTMDRCTFTVEKAVDIARGRSSDQNHRTMLGGIAIVALIGGVFLVKKMQEVVEKREKKNM